MLIVTFTLVGSVYVYDYFIREHKLSHKKLDDGWLAKTVREIGLQWEILYYGLANGVGRNYYGLVIEVGVVLREAMY